MKIIYFLLAILIFTQFSAQKRFIYEYRFKPDISKPDSIVTDYMNLDSDMKSSLFSSSFKMTSDSLRDAMLQNKNTVIFPKYNPNLIYTISKNYVDSKVIYHLADSNIKFKITEKEPIKWKISSEKKVINKFNCQKANADFHGRKWIAWFSESIGIQDGPYKFSGLPGLIIKIEDERSNHSWELIEIKNLSTREKLLQFDNEKEITRKQLVDLLNNRSKNIVSNIGEMFVQSNMIGFHMRDGNIIQLDSKTKNIEKELQKQVTNSNNPIELKD